MTSASSLKVQLFVEEEEVFDEYESDSDAIEEQELRRSCLE